MPAVKMNISLEGEVVEILRRRALEEQKPASRYLAELIRADDRRRQDELAAEGYQRLSADTADFAAAALPLAMETWPDWEPFEPTSASGDELAPGMRINDGAEEG